ncbi:alpha/beta hydrolase-fold protein [Actinomycetospora corticicola]|uniref:S-formylglutathione hydrolase FrmB n=1 Tax=Actinomycetospora corticicola TaxID=663602 RepID=A0A7Y9J412_9PSEU|nr:alpha/beta hydrolase-fold protein [Actinomycetospora corticicola]NYD34209.1 S-formylglutathione hydrolase FrmB [Actinomycetospora corticicola]
MSRRTGVSLLQGWLPITIQALAAVLLVLLAVWLLRGARPRPVVVTLVVAAAAAALAVVGTRWSLRDQDLQADPPPVALWVWAALAAVALVLLVAAVVRRGWWRRGLAVGTLLLALLAAGVQANVWVGYFPTVAEAYAQLTAAPLPDEASPAAVDAMRGTPRTTGVVVPMTTPDDVSHFAHRTEYVYLPPAWFAPHAPSLPAVMMVGGEFATPTDWIRTGDAVVTADAYARTHGGLAPILVFADSTGSFRNDTECVDGPRGNAATHLVDEVRPYVVAHFAADASPAQWGVVGWSTGGTCAVDLGVTRPDAFSAFEDIQGDLAPNAGGAQQTLAQLYGGNAAAQAAFDPTTVLAHHAPYPDSAGWFADNPSTRPARHAPTTAPPADPRAGMGGRKDPAPATMQGQQATEARTLCAEATARGITCSVHISPGKHTWQFAHAAFADALPWLAGRLGLPSAVGAPTVRS